MAGPAAILREIHRLRRHARDLQNEIDRGPRTLALQQAKIARQEEAHREAQDAIKKLKVGTHDKEMNLRAKNQLIDKHQKQLNEATGKKEYDALKLEIANEQKECGLLEDDILNDMATTEELTAQLPQLADAAKRAKDDVTRFENEHRSRLAGLTEQLNQTTQQLREVEATLPDDVRPQYDRLVAARGDDALSVVQDRTCVACYTEITAQNRNDLLQNLFVFCKSCGRMLYLAEQPAVVEEATKA
jgi:predicted  nucleic acid-binding Zn-ribbon protein